MKEKKDLLRNFFKLLLSRAYRESCYQGHPFHYSSTPETTISEFKFIKKKILHKIKPSEIEGLLSYTYDELFSKENCTFKIMTRLPSNIDSYDGYIFEKETNKLYYVRVGCNRKVPPEEVHINDMDEFQKTLRKTMEGKNEKYLNKNEINSLITKNGGHIPEQFINQVEARRFLSGAHDIIEEMTNKESNKSSATAVGLTALLCTLIITIPFIVPIYNRWYRYFYSRQSLQREWSKQDVLMKVNEIPQLQKTAIPSMAYINTSVKEIFETRHHDEEIGDKWISYRTPYLKKSDLFNSSGEIRKMFSSSVETKEYTFPLPSSYVPKDPVLASKEQRLRMFCNNYEKAKSKNRSKEQIQQVINRINNSP